MREGKKNIKYIILAIFLIAILPVSLWLVAINLDIASKDNAEKHLKRNKNDIEIIINYYSLLDCKSISITYLEFNATNYKKTITSEKVVNAFTHLFEKKGYSVIGRNNNTIYFQIWTKLRDFGSGIAYSINKKEKPTIEYLTKLEPLSKDGWYYYETDYNEWEQNN